MVRSKKINEKEGSKKINENYVLSEKRNKEEKKERN